MLKRITGTLIFALSTHCLLVGQTTINGSRTITGAWDAANATTTRPAKSGSTLPASCNVGEQFFKQDAAAGQNLYFCTAANSWTQMAGASGAGAPFTAKYVVQTADGGLPNAQALGALGTGILKSATTTGVLSIASGSDLPAHTHSAAGSDTQLQFNNAGAPGGTACTYDSANQKISCPGGFESGGTGSGILAVKGASGSNEHGFKGTTGSYTNNLYLALPDANPAGQVLSCATPVAGDSSCSWLSAVAASRSIGTAAASGLTGGGDLSADRTLGLITTCADNQLLKYTAAGGWACANDAGSTGGLADPGANGMVARTGAGSTAARTVSGTASQITVTNGDGVSGNPVLALAGNVLTSTFGITIDGGGSAITTGSKGFVHIPYSCTVNQWTLLADQATGSTALAIDLKRSTYASFPATASIVGSGNKPTIASAAQSGQAVPSGWTSTAISADDVIEFNVDATSTVTRVTLVVKCTR